MFLVGVFDFPRVSRRIKHIHGFLLVNAAQLKLMLVKWLQTSYLTLTLDSLFSGILKGDNSQIMGHPSLRRYAQLHLDLCKDVVPEFLRDGWQPDMSDPMEQQAMQMVKVVTSTIRKTDMVYKMMRLQQGVERGRAHEDHGEAVEAQDPAHEARHSSETIWKCHLCDCDHTLLVGKASCAKGYLSLVYLALPKEGYLCHPCALHVRKKIKKLGPEATEEQLTQMIAKRRDSGLRKANVLALREPKELDSRDGLLPRSAKRTKKK